ncbi:hypothetical protein BCR33DRAFT_717099 [Rhizoclosmatium globosum]|uniref:N-acetyltransferase domain-containing protein n=1 Tax=Rhizoclosmatium globosum TaxID=329046 RepID=A0A1Y2CCD2_9FUNG|nr:hypothetical protein BCR33DRAFT_717099 [Rhizoclosmatium globosum]|eukprot:ORY43975.1 hypothetical protein BCR33DRAFT_717099 [Rhizoclosmatium globosum]
MASETITVRRAVSADAAAIAKLHIKSWNEAIRPLNVFTDAFVDTVNARRLESHTNRLRNDVQETGASKIVGLCMMGRSWMLEEFPDYINELMALYVDSDYYGSGAAKKMIAEGIRLLGWDKTGGKMICKALELNKRKIIGREVSTKEGENGAVLVMFGWDALPLLE